MALRNWLWANAVGLILVAGCSSSNGLLPVSGKVTYQGQPVSSATILFMGVDGTRPATAISQTDGSYALQTLDSPGAMPGQYSVVVTKTDIQAPAGEPPSMEEAAKQAGRPPPPPKRLLPAKYGDASNTPLRFEVKPGQTNRFDLDLKD